MTDTAERLNKNSQAKLLRLLLQGTAARRQAFLKPYCDYLGKESFRVLIQSCNLMWNVSEQTPKSFCVFPEYYCLN